MPEHIGAIKLPINRLHIELTNICNFSCEFCPDSKMKRKRGMMPKEVAESILDDIGRTKIAKTILFHVMGEPLLHPDLIDIVSYAGSKGIETCITTNGSRLDQHLLEELLRAGITKIIISLQTPDEKTFALRGATDIQFEEYAEKITAIAKRFLHETEDTKLIISFLSSPLRRLIIPIFPEVSIADRSSDLKVYLRLWAERILSGNSLESKYVNVLKQIREIGIFKENTIHLSHRVAFHTRILGDWSIHFDKKNVNAQFGYCPGVRENFGILWNGDYTLCCTDFDGRTSTANYGNVSITDYLSSSPVQDVVKGFNRFRVIHPYCRQCIGDRGILGTMVKQIGSIAYFKWIKGH